MRGSGKLGVGSSLCQRLWLYEHPEIEQSWFFMKMRASGFLFWSNIPIIPVDSTHYLVDLINSEVVD